MSSGNVTSWRESVPEHVGSETIFEVFDKMFSASTRIELACGRRGRPVLLHGQAVPFIKYFKKDICAV